MCYYFFLAGAFFAPLAAAGFDDDLAVEGLATATILSAGSDGALSSFGDFFDFDSITDFLLDTPWEVRATASSPFSA